MDQSDQVLVAQSQQGNRGAFEQLVRRTARIIFARIYLQTGDVHRTEDLVQETFLVAWKSIGQVDRPEGFHSWLFSVASSVVIDAARRESRKKRSGKRVEEARLRLVEDQAPRPAEAAEQAEARHKAMEALRSLPEEYQAPLALRYIAGADYGSISRQLGMSNGALRGMMSRGMGLLRRAMTNQDERKPQMDTDAHRLRGTGEPPVPR